MSSQRRGWWWRRQRRMNYAVLGAIIQGWDCEYLIWCQVGGSRSRVSRSLDWLLNHGIVRVIETDQADDRRFRFGLSAHYWEVVVKNRMLKP